MVTDFVAFLGVSILVIVTPGPDTALVIRNTLRGGRSSGIFTALGVAMGQAIWTLATSAGIATLLRASEPAFAAVKLAGAVYLVFLGVQALRDAVRSGAWKTATNGDGSLRRHGSPVTLRQGVLSNLGNPKMAVFFTSLLPQFTPHGQASFSALLVLGLVFCSLTLVWLTGYSIALARAGDVLLRPRIRRTLEGLAGAVLVAFGLRLATEHR